MKEKLLKWKKKLIWNLKFSIKKKTQRTVQKFGTDAALSEWFFSERILCDFEILSKKKKFYLLYYMYILKIF